MAASKHRSWRFSSYHYAVCPALFSCECRRKVFSLVSRFQVQPEKSTFVATYVCDAHEELGVDVGAVSFEVRMRFDLHLYHQVTCGPAQALVALLGDAEVDSIVDALWYVDGLFHLLRRDAAATAGRARIPNDSSLAVAVAADLLDHEGSLPNSLKAGAPAGSTSRLSGAGLGL